jgi:hypothetical protein
MISAALKQEGGNLRFVLGSAEDADEFVPTGAVDLVVSRAVFMATGLILAPGLRGGLRDYSAGRLVLRRVWRHEPGAGPPTLRPGSGRRISVAARKRLDACRGAR